MAAAAPPQARRAARRGHGLDAAAHLRGAGGEGALAVPVDASRARIAQLDEYVGLPAEHPESYRSVLRREVAGAARAGRGRVHGPGRHRPRTCRARARRTTAALADAGRGGPAAARDRDGRAHRVQRAVLVARLPHPDQDADRSRPGWTTRGSSTATSTQVPHHVITQGIGTILEARHLVLLATGEGKAEAVAATVEGPVAAVCPASALQLHPHATVVVDEAAASKLKLGGLLPRTPTPTSRSGRGSRPTPQARDGAGPPPRGVARHVAVRGTRRRAVLRLHAGSENPLAIQTTTARRRRLRARRPPAARMHTACPGVPRVWVRAGAPTAWAARASSCGVPEALRASDHLRGGPAADAGGAVGRDVQGAARAGPGGRPSRRRSCRAGPRAGRPGPRPSRGGGGRRGRRRRCGGPPAAASARRPRRPVRPPASGGGAGLGARQQRGPARRRRPTGSRRRRRCWRRG